MDGQMKQRMDKTTLGPRRAVWLTLRALVLVALAALVLSQPDGRIARAAASTVSLAAGSNHTCALTAAGGVKCWGYNGLGSLGDGGTTNRTTPVDVSGLTSGVAAVAAGGDHTCALTMAGGVKCWGVNGLGTVGDGSTTNRLTPVDVTGLTSGVAAVAAGGSHTCALTVAGGVKCWGYNFYGALGDGTTIQRTTPVDVTGLTSSVAAVAAGYAHTCALTTAGGVKCWGNDSYGQLGDGTTTSIRTTPVDVTGLTSGVAAVAAGYYHTCALTTAGGVKCWGYNGLGSLGDGTVTQRTTPVNVTGLTSGVTAVAAGSSYHTCALTAAGGTKCWGYNAFAELGDGTTTNRSTPIDVTGLTSGVAAVAAGGSHTCALTVAGGTKCWGYNAYGELGDGTTTQRTTPVDVVGFTPPPPPPPVAHALSAGNSYTCALTAAGGVKCWGHNFDGKLGDGTTTQRTTPVDVTGLTSGVAAVAAGGESACALTSAGGVKCWGDNGSGQLGDGTTAQRTTPVDVTGLTSGVAAVAATCALTAAGGLKCWGNNSRGQLGDGTTAQRTTPVDVTGLTSGVAAVAAGGPHTCALTIAGGVKCWGYNERGQLGDGTTTQRNTPVDVTGLTSGVAAVAEGDSHTCALTIAGGVKCWGYNAFGELGDGTTTDRTTPVDVTGLTSGVAAVAAGSHYTCALTTAGGVKCWGSNERGRLGDGTTTDRTTPIDVTGLTSGVAAVAAGLLHTCALTTAGGLKCWGYNFGGELGDGTTIQRTTPTAVVGISGPPGTIPLVTFSARPLRGAAGFALGAQPVLALRDSSGALRSGDSTTSATLGFLPGTGASGATVTCAPATATAAAGVVTFAGCTIDRPGFGYVLRAAAANGEAIGLTAPFNVTLAGDTNGDCSVSIVDFSLVVSHFGKNSGSPGWTTQNAAGVAPFAADLNGDNGVTILDFSMVVSRFGTVATSCAPASN